ncbi:MAG: hypothetical protein IKS20_12830, partial [Victivallales bacterium]|nr:hypothetical protein [Victivallales bacterium]
CPALFLKACFLIYPQIVQINPDCRQVILTMSRQNHFHTHFQNEISENLCQSVDKLKTMPFRWGLDSYVYLLKSTAGMPSEPLTPAPP